ncbi:MULTISPECIES: molybdopterin-dependent oxidoreductase [unclassified Cupriavidus]|uniref:molybdopterin-dependent oxidoreductase n=1 Tax=unclassified Cupriavidus TaxID=2640874 RepID=UPI001C00097E|nr:MULTISPECIES: molybdopterin-dependent oxidoreductase [unclassified Cupriavidus]MCA3189064.1 molybdopterin-dependent oxidoreductase [Cupriavidus sp.]MCA3198783.1 molybdopterin-dependent oxidoreductase [Cupriavidus sp.]MCA3201529.1 molybdopterin-dependent oxidoreductase [Cupriavidus sp.]MCA3209915.1 molybdopterin-dependent oxidoreductase [Cupriavidus sp.]QWE97211.1 molybdopterin-dependent oxidoreductase [Cupriavidus sp. EM10]
MNPKSSRSSRPNAIDRQALAIDVRRELDAPSRRLFGKRILTLGGLAMLTGCSLADDASVESFLSRVSRMNDRVQAWLFDPNRLAPTYTEADITRPFPFNAFYGIDEVTVVNGGDFRLKVGGLVRETKSWTLDELYALPKAEQITRHICVEGWSAIGRWGGTPFAGFLQRIGADTTARYVGFRCADDYYESIDMATALHPQTLLTFTYDGERLPPKYGFPMKLRMPTKLGYKNPKHIMELFVTNTFPGGYWVDQGYNWFGGS